tara:strand:+ start:1628 stop:2728 length:1101 start_codon:yes stop_codon:yes gene_type:complete
MKILLFIKSKDYTYGGPAYVCKIFKSLLTNNTTNNIEIDINDDQDIKLLNKQELINKISQYDLVSIHGIWSLKNSLIAKICRKCLIPYVITLHGMLDPWSWKKNFFFKIIYFLIFLKKDLKYASSIHCLNNFELELTKKFLKKKNIFIFENLLETKNYTFDPDTLKKKISGKLDILYFSRITKKKGLEKFLKVITGIKKDFFIKIIGPTNTSEDKKYLAELKKLTYELKLNENVKFYDAVGNNYQKSMTLSGSDLFILPSSQEGDSIALKESILHGLPLLITRNCKFEVSYDNKTFGYYLNEDFSNAKEILDRLIDMDNNSYEQLKKNAITYSKQFLLNDKKKNELNLIFENIIRSKDNNNFIYIK